MALTTTSLAAAITATQTKGLTVTSTSSGFPAIGTIGSRQAMLIDGEYMLIDRVVKSGVIDVLQRGYEGTQPVAHDALAPLTTSSDASDFPVVPAGGVNVRPPYGDDILSIGQNGAIAVPNKNTTFLLDKATALASTTLASPTVAQNGLQLTFTSNTAAAHVITFVGEDGTTGGSTTATFTAFKGATVVFKASAGVWNVVSLVSVTIT